MRAGWGQRDLQKSILGQHCNVAKSPRKPPCRTPFLSKRASTLAPCRSGTARSLPELEKLLGPEAVLSGPAAERAYDCDAYTVDRSKPAAVVLPTSTDQVAAIVRWCVAQSVPYTARGAGTGLSGGALPALGGVVISSKKLNKILEIDAPNRCLLAQAGAVNRKLSDVVRVHGLHFAPDPSSQSVSTLGGNIAENSGGPHTLKYGVTVQHILGLTLVDPTGEVLQLGGKAGGGCQESPGLHDMLGLVVGGEGTLGVVTEAWVKLGANSQCGHHRPCLVLFGAPSNAIRGRHHCHGNDSCRLGDHGSRNHQRRLAGVFDHVRGRDGGTVALVECDSAHELGASERVDAEMAAVRKVCETNGAIEIRVAADEEERAQLWKVRKKGIGAMGRIAPSIVTHDGVIPRSKLPEMLDYVYRVAEEHKIGVANLFHAGDGNLHPCFYFDDRDPAQVQAVVEAGEQIIGRCIELGGSVTGEHGIGVEKIDLMSLMFSPEDLRLQADAKKIFNDGDLCNPCKVLPSQKSCVEHRKRWRGTAW